MSPADIVVVGAGLAGWRTVSALRATGFPGAITLVGDEVHPPYDRPPLSKGVLSGASDPSSAVLADAGRLAELDVTFRSGVSATNLDTQRRTITLSDASQLGFDQLVIATGASPRRLPGSRALAGVHVLRTLDDVEAIRKTARSANSVVVLGGGVLGCEIAATLNASLPVTLVEAAPSLLDRAFGQSQVGDALTHMHRSAGINVVLGTRVERLIGESAVTGVLCDDGAAHIADMVIIALGVVPSTAWLEGSGVACDDGVLVDSQLRTNIAGVFALGDVARKHANPDAPSERLEHWTSATEQAEVVAHNLLASHPGDLAEHDTLPYVWSDQHSRKLQIIGRPSLASSEHIVFEDQDSHRMLVLYFAEKHLSAAVALGMPKYVVKLRKLIDERVAEDSARATAATWFE